MAGEGLPIARAGGRAVQAQGAFRGIAAEAVGRVDRPHRARANATAASSAVRVGFTAKPGDLTDQAQQRAQRAEVAAPEPGAHGIQSHCAGKHQGGDHTGGLTIRAKVDHLDGKANIAVSQGAQINMAGYDTLGACIFAGFGFATAPETVRDLINARYAWDVGTDFLQVLGRESLKLEREFNARAGFTKADDRLPEFMTLEPLPPFNPVFDVSEEDLDGVFNW